MFDMPTTLALIAFIAAAAYQLGQRSHQNEIRYWRGRYQRLHHRVGVLLETDLMRMYAGDEAVRAFSDHESYVPPMWEAEKRKNDDG